MTGKQNKYLSVKEAAQLLGVTPLTIRRYIYRHLLVSQRTPGGQHRIALDDLNLLRGDAFSKCSKAHSTINQPLPAGTCESKVRLQELEKEIELLRKQLAVVSSGCFRIKEMVEEPLGAVMDKKSEHYSESLVFEVLGPGCHACDTLAAVLEEILQELRINHGGVVRVKELEKIAEYGPLLTPALVLGGNVVVSGVVPSREQLVKVIKAGVN